MKNHKDLTQETTNYCTEALFWYQYGFKIIPVQPGSKKITVKSDSWFFDLNPQKVQEHWAKHPENEIGCILGCDIIMFETDDIEYEYALPLVEEDFGLKPKLVSTANGEQHYYRCAPGTMILSNSFYSTEKLRGGIDIKTAGDLIVLPPSRGKHISMREAENKDELSFASQGFIDEIYQLNGIMSPSEMIKMAAENKDYETVEYLQMIWCPYRLKIIGR